VTAYQLDPGDQVAWGGWAIPQPWCNRLVPGQTVTVEIHGRPVVVRIRVVRPKYAIADEVRR
jgi:hypothetical protein